MQKTKKKILIADDDLAILDAISIMLSEEGFDVNTEADGKKLLQMEDNLPDLIFLDIWMSGSNGRDICKTLKTNPKTKHVPIIMVSANRDTAKIAKEAGAEDFLAKPFEMTELISKAKKYTQ